MKKEDFKTKRTEIISNMLDNPNEDGIFPTTKCYEQLDVLYDTLTIPSTVSDNDESEIRQMMNDECEQFTKRYKDNEDVKIGFHEGWNLCYDYLKNK